MKVGKRVGLVLGAGVLSPLLTLALGAAITSAQVQSNQAENTESSTLEFRLQKRKDTLKTRLTAAQQVRLRARCQAAQTLVTTLSEKVESIQKKRVNAHDRVQDHLTILRDKLGDQADTTKLQAAMEELQRRTDAVEAKLASYSQALVDLRQMNCTADPTGFKASLDEARTLRIELVQDVADIRKFIQDSLKPELQVIKQSLENKRGEVIN